MLRVGKDVAALELPVRRRIFERVVDMPGVYLRELQRLLDMPMGALEYHLDRLARGGFIVADKNDHKRYFPTGMPPTERALVAALRRPRERRILSFLGANGPTRHGDLGRALELPGSTLSTSLDRLCRRGLLTRTRQGREVTYGLAPEPATVFSGRGFGDGKPQAEA